MTAPRPLPFHAARCCRDFARQGDGRSRPELFAAALRAEAEAAASASASAERDHRFRAHRLRRIPVERAQRFRACAAEWAGTRALSEQAVRAVLTVAERARASADPLAAAWSTLPEGATLRGVAEAGAAHRAAGDPLRAALRLAGGPFGLGGSASSGGPALFRKLYRLGVVDYNRRPTPGGLRLAEALAAGLLVAALGGGA